MRQKKAEDKRGYGLRLSRSPKHSFRISWHQNSLDVYYFINKPIYTDKALWYDACRLARVDHVVYDQSLKNLMKRI